VALQTMGDFLYGIALAQGRYSHPLSLAPHHAQVYSQNGEDGIIAEILPDWASVIVRSSR
jgi:hypothetical protein